jgi:hypothetical protein
VGNRAQEYIFSPGEIRPSQISHSAHKAPVHGKPVCTCRPVHNPSVSIPTKLRTNSVHSPRYRTAVELAKQFYRMMRERDASAWLPWRKGRSPTSSPPFGGCSDTFLSSSLLFGAVTTIRSICAISSRRRCWTASGSSCLRMSNWNSCCLGGLNPASFCGRCPRSSRAVINKQWLAVEEGTQT